MAATKRIDVDRIDGAVVALSLAEHTLRAESRLAFDDGTAAALAVGAQVLTAEQGLSTEIRPTYEAAVSLPVAGDLTLKASLRGAFETEDTDDPLASWMQRLDSEVEHALSPKLALSAGAYLEYRDNLVLGNHERARGAYVELARALTDETALVFRLDAKRRHFSVIDVREDTVDAFVGLRGRL